MNIFYLAVGMLLAWWALHGNVLVPLDGTYADRWFYLACLPCLMLAILWLEKRSIAWNSKLVVSLGCLVTIALSVRTAVRLDDWCHPIELYRRETAFHPWDAIMTNNVGVELFRSGNIQDSAEYFQRASQLNPIWDVAWNNQGAVAQRLGQAGQALALYEHAVSLGTYSLAYENYAGLLLATGQLDRCRDFLGQKALRIFPENPSLLATAHQLGM
jgi:tetratricopeptide (TPR) repeat protein